MLLLALVVLTVGPPGADGWHDGTDGKDIALPFFTGNWRPGNRNDHFGDIGIEFQPVKNFIIAALGRALGSGVKLQTTARVTLWDVATQAALVHVDVGPSSAVEGDYAFEPITPIEVVGGKDYRMSQQCTNGMADKWNDLTITPAEVATSSEKEYATFVGGVNVNGWGYPIGMDGLRRRAGVVNFKIAVGCPVPTGIANAASNPCGAGANGTHVGDGGICIATCATGYSPSVASLSCSAGVLSPSTFTCSASPCANLTGIEHGAAQSCAEGTVVLSGGVCTSQCEQGYSPSVAQLNCSFGELTPSTFTCSPDPCLMPSDIQNAASPPCSEGSEITSGSNCSTLCSAGFSPSVAVLTCLAGELTPGNFTCLQNPCLAPTGIEHAMAPSCLQGDTVSSPGVCSAQCAEGYLPSPPLLGCYLGELDPANFTCGPRPCPAPDQINNAGTPSCVEGSTITSGSNCTTQCKQGYTSSTAVLTCSLGKLEPNNFTCSSAPCMAPTGVAFAHSEPCLEGPVLTSGSICTTRCMEGYTASVASLTCELGELTPANFTCTPTPCTVPSGLENADVARCSEGPIVTSGEQCTTKCIDGYTPSVAVLNCSFGVLTPLNFSCKPNSCPEPHASACLEGSTIESGDVCHTQCPQGYYPSPSSLSCTLGELSPNNYSCLPLSCSVPYIKNATTPPCIEGSTIQSGGTCTPQCDSGFLPNVTELNCTLGVLSPSLFECTPLPCEAPSGMEYGLAQSCSEGQVIASGSVCTAVCALGYSPSAPTLDCLATVLTPANFTCSPSPCTAPSVQGADLGSCSEGSEILSGGTCTSQCDVGYTPSVLVLNCSMGVLTPSVFFCVGDPCPVPTGIQFALDPLCAEAANSSYISHGDVCTPRCMSGYSPSAPVLNCTAGKLVPASFECQPSPCTQPTGIADVRIAFGYATPCAEDPINHDHGCTTQCSDGFSPSVDFLNCSFGDLTPSTFTCNGNPCPIPNGTENSADPPCAESGNASYISHGSSCTLQCVSGYTPVVPVLHCWAGQLMGAENFTCLPSSCAAPTGIENAATPSCAQGTYAEHGGACTAQCQVGFTPSVASLSCSFGELAPVSFTCVPHPCSAPTGILYASLQTCSEGYAIDSGGVCTPQCAPGYTPSVAFLNCTLGVLSPATFSCLGDDCRLPSVANVAADPCAGENWTAIRHGEICTLQCKPHYLPSVRYLECDQGSLLPAAFQCYHCFNVENMVSETDTGTGGVLTEETGKAYGSTPDDHWCHYKCGAMVVSYSSTRGMRWVAQALFSHANCAEFVPWRPQDVMARIDVLVVTPGDFDALPDSTLVNNSFRGAVVLVDMSCGEPRPPALQCWQFRTLYVGADRVAGLLHSAAFLEVPPGAVHLLARHGDGLVSAAPLAVPLAKLRAPHRRLPASGKKTKLLAYISDDCSPAAERFFDLAVEALQGMGTVEALGRCHGSHPETVPARCGGPCEAARQNVTAELEPFRFALAFESSAESTDRCPKHVGGMVLDALIAGAIPVYRGPDEALSILDGNALVFVPPFRPLEEGLAKMRATMLDAQLPLTMAATAALHSAPAHRWFTWDEALLGERNKLAADAEALVKPLLKGAPHWRCAEHALARTPACDSEPSRRPIKTFA